MSILQKLSSAPSCYQYHLLYFNRSISLKIHFLLLHLIVFLAGTSKMNPSWSLQNFASLRPLGRDLQLPLQWVPRLKLHSDGYRRFWLDFFIWLCLFLSSAPLASILHLVIALGVSVSESRYEKEMKQWVGCRLTSPKLIPTSNFTE